MQHSNPPSVTLRVYVVFVDCPELAPVKSEAVIVGSVIAESIRLRVTSVFMCKTWEQISM